MEYLKGGRDRWKGGLFTQEQTFFPGFQELLRCMQSERSGMHSYSFGVMDSYFHGHIVNLRRVLDRLNQDPQYAVF